MFLLVLQLLLPTSYNIQMFKRVSAAAAINTVDPVE